MHLFLIRHLESEKNRKQSFASFEDKEPLTEEGKKQGILLAKELKSFFEENQWTIKQIYSASSERAKQTASMLSSTFGVPVQSYSSLCSSKTGVLQGKSEEEVAKERPEFIKQLYLYRKGIVSSYDFEIIEGKESKKSLEERVMNTIQEIINIPGEDAKVIVFHRSSLTAAILNFARQNSNYPKDFYGFIKLHYGFLTILNNEKDGMWTFDCVDEPVEKAKQFIKK